MAVGNNRAIAAAGPIPGSTPTRVPRRHPTRQYKRFVKETDTENPVKRLSKLSNAYLLKNPQSL
jgi:hypothetical protein